MSDPQKVDEAAAYVTTLIEPEAGEGHVPEVAEEEPEVEAEVALEDDEAVAGDAPQWWDAQAKAHFAELPPEVQDIVWGQEYKREAVVQKAKAQARDAAEAALHEAGFARTLAERLAEAMPDHVGNFQEYYGDIDWEAYAHQDPEAAEADWTRYQQGLNELHEVEAARVEAEALYQNHFVREQGRRLEEIAPEIARNADTLQAIGDYLPGTGIAAEALMHASAEEIVILNKARMYDEMMFKAQSRAGAPSRSATPVRVPPQGAGRTITTSQQREARALHNRFAETRDRDTAAELISKLGY